MQIVSANASLKAWSEQTTTDEYEDLGKPWDKSHLKTCTLVIENTGSTNKAKAKVLGSVDGENYDIEVAAEAEVAASGAITVKWSDYYTGVVVQIKSAEAGKHTTIKARAAGIPV